MASIAENINDSVVRIYSAHMDKEALVNMEQGYLGDNDTAHPMEQSGESKEYCNGDNGGRLEAARGTNLELLEKAPFQSQHTAFSTNAVFCVSPGHINGIYDEDTQKEQAYKGVLGPNSSTNSPFSCIRVDGIRDMDTACTGALRDSKAETITEVSQKIEHMAKSLMEMRTSSSVCSKHVKADATCKNSGETHTQSAGKDMAIGSCHTSTKPTHAPLGFAVSKTKYKIFFTSEDAKNADSDTPIRLVTFSHDSSSSLGKIKQEKAGHTNTSSLYKNSQVLNIYTGRTAVNNDADTGASVVRLVKKKHKDTIQVDCTTPQYTGPSGVPESVRAVDTRHSLHEDATSYEDSLCDLVERLSTKNNIEDVCASIQREVHYVDPEVSAKDRQHEKKGFLCRVFSTVFGCCV